MFLISVRAELGDEIDYIYFAESNVVIIKLPVQDKKLRVHFAGLVHSVLKEQNGYTGFIDLYEGSARFVSGLKFKEGSFVVGIGILDMRRIEIKILDVMIIK